MKPPEKEAQELFNAMYNEFPESYNKEQMAIDVQVAKCQAIIAVDLIIRENHKCDENPDTPQEFVRILIKRMKHWQKVKEAIKSLQT